MQIDEEDRKLFAGGLNQEVTQDDLKVLFTCTFSIFCLFDTIQNMSCCVSKILLC